jgi:Short C-terminal domain
VAMQDQAQVADLQQQVNQLQTQQAQAAVAPPPAAAAPSLTDQLNSLAQMKQAGILSDAEFEAAKAKLLSA